jgi:hypothetical protein
MPTSGSGSHCVHKYNGLSHLIGQHLIDVGNEVMFIASQKAYVYLRQYFDPRVREIFGLCLMHEI